ncbi:MAG TPA: nitronate monooxygenase [Solirubrobacteraceae bacterium]|nr:nitronate monooxygenase [Solirubrobacteraceae bacterium]
MDLLDRLGLQHPIAQAGMGGGTSGAELAGAVSAAGGLGTVGITLAPQELHDQIVQARTLAPGRPIAANLLMPFVSMRHVQACVDGGADCVVLFCGFDRGLVQHLRAAGVVVLQQVGTCAQAARALLDGADGLIAQGIEAGGHLLGVEHGLDFLPSALEVAEGRPVLLAGGIAEAGDVRRALTAGAVAAVAGTRFLLTEECAAHPAYKQRVLGATETLETLLFGVGWHERHRVVPNLATERWCGSNPFGPRPVRAINRIAAPLLRRLPSSLSASALRMQRPSVPFYGPASILLGMDERLVDVTPLYAGETASRIDSIVPAAQAVRELAGA